MSRRIALALALALLALLPRAATATPARVNALDAGNFLVPDDWDVANYYSLAPEFAGHLYLYYPLTKKPFGWANVDVKPLGTFVLWLNLPNPTTPIFAAVPKLSSLGFSNLDLDEDEPGVEEWDPRETRIGSPDLKVGAGWGRRLSDAVSVGMCSRFAFRDESSSEEKTGGGVGLLSDPSSILAVTGLLSATLTGYEAHQKSSSIALGPSVSWKAESFSLDLHAAWISLGVDNSWEGSLAADPAAGYDTGHLTRTLEFDGGASYLARGKFMMPLTDETTLAVSGQVISLDLSTKHTVQESFTGAGLTAAQKAGANHVDGTETLTAMPWTAMAGVFSRSHEYLVVFGVGVNGAALESLDEHRLPKAGGTGANDTVVADRAHVTVDSFDLPLLMGVEYSMFSWLRLRAVAQRNLLGSTTTKATSSSDANLDGTTDASSASTEETHGVQDWLLRLGFGLTTERIGWDVLFNLQPSDPDYASPFFAVPAKATWTRPSITTAVVYKW